MKSYIFRVALVIHLSLFISSCGFFLGQPLKELSGSQLPDVIVMYNQWVGLSASAPISTDYSLKQDGDNFIGEVNFSVGGYFSNTYKASAPISIPVDVIKEFLNKLAKSNPQAGTYTPYTAWTDDYPSILLDIRYPSKKFEFYTTSQGDKNIPWKLTIGPDEYVVNSGIPSDALAILRPYISYDVLDGLIQQVESEVHAP